MNKFAKELGFLMISIFLVSIPFLTGFWISRVSTFDFLTLCGLILTLGEVGCLMGLFMEGEQE